MRFFTFCCQILSILTIAISALVGEQLSPYHTEIGKEMSNELAEMEDEDIQRDTRSSTTRSGRKSRRPRVSRNGR